MGTVLGRSDGTSHPGTRTCDGPPGRDGTHHGTHGQEGRVHVDVEVESLQISIKLVYFNAAVDFEQIYFHICDEDQLKYLKFCREIVHFGLTPT